MAMIEMNGIRFAKGKRGIVDTLFNLEGTASGYYTVKATGVNFHAIDGEHIATVNAYGVLGRASKLPDGKTWYDYGNPKLIGNYDSYTRKVEESARALEIAGIERRADLRG